MLTNFMAFPCSLIAVLGIVGYQTEKEALEFARTSQNLNPQVLLFNSDGTNFTKAQTLPKKLSITLRPLIKGGRISTANTFPPDDKPKCTLCKSCQTSVGVSSCVSLYYPPMYGYVALHSLVVFNGCQPSVYISVDS